MRILSHYRFLTLTVPDRRGTGSPVTIEFNIENAFNTPVQRNLEYCGLY